MGNRKSGSWRKERTHDFISLRNISISSHSFLSTFMFFWSVTSRSLLSSLEGLLCSLTTGPPCTGGHAAIICVQATADDMAFTTPRWVTLRHPYPLPPFLTHKFLFIHLHAGLVSVCVCMCVPWEHPLCTEAVCLTHFVPACSMCAQ